MARKQESFITMQEYTLSEVAPEIRDFLQIYREDVQRKASRLLLEDPEVKLSYEQILSNYWREKACRHASNFLEHSDKVENISKVLSLASKGYSCKNFTRRNPHNILAFEENPLALEEYSHCLTFSLPVLKRIETEDSYAVVDEKQYRCYANLESFCSFGNYARLTIENGKLYVDAQIYRTSLQTKNHLLDLD